MFDRHTERGGCRYSHIPTWQTPEIAVACFKQAIGLQFTIPCILPNPVCHNRTGRGKSNQKKQ